VLEELDLGDTDPPAPVTGVAIERGEVVVTQRRRDGACTLRYRWRDGHLRPHPGATPCPR
jgi:hypothetical protein